MSDDQYTIDWMRSEIDRLLARVEDAEAKQKIDQAQCDEMTEQAGTMAMEISTLRARVAALEEVVEAAERWHQAAVEPLVAYPPGNRVQIMEALGAASALKAALAKLDEAKKTPDAAARLAETEQQQWDRVHWGGEEP